MYRMGIPQPDYTPDGVLAEITRVVPFLEGATSERPGKSGKQWPRRRRLIERRRPPSRHVQCDRTLPLNRPLLPR